MPSLNTTLSLAASTGSLVVVIVALLGLRLG
jgi:hypothetical protein